MNRNRYRLVFNTTLGMHVPAAETARGRGKTANGPARALAGLAFAGAVLTAPALTAAAELAANALPSGAVVKYGNIGIAQSGNTLNINQASQAGIIHWNTFNIGSGATVNFNQPNVTAATLNRITGNETSVIQGALNATGAVYVINRNGIVFDKGAQVNLHTLVASSLDIKDDDLFKNGFLTANPLTPAFGDAYTQYVGSAPPGMVNVAEGARITAATGGRVILLAPDVENKGIIQTDTGQVILAAGHKAYFHLTNSSDSNTLLRGLLVEVESGGSAVNLGQLAAGQGDVTLIGKLVRQDGVITATTSANLNGTIHLLAREIDPRKDDQYLLSGYRSANTTGSVEIGANSRTVILPALDADKIKAAIDRGQLTQARVDAYHRGEANVADFYAYMPDTTLQDAQAFSPSQIKAEGHDIRVQQGALLRAPSGVITLQALQSASADPNHIFLTNSNDPGSFALNGRCLDCRVQIDDGAVLDVSGLRDVAVDMARNVVEVELRGSVLADSPLLHDTSGPLYGKKIRVDIRDTGTVDIDGQTVTRQGTTLVDASPYIAQIGRKIDEKSTAGGKINLYSEGALVVQQGATMDLSGGSIAYQTGQVATSQLVYQGRLYDIATARGDIAYTGLGPDRVVTEQGYLEGKDAGALNIVSPLTVLQGDIRGGTVIGERQRGQGGSALPKGATLSLGMDNPSGPEAGRDYRVLNEVLFSSASATAAPAYGSPIADDLKRTLILDAARLKAGNVTQLAVYTNNGIRIDSGQTLDMGPKGSVSLTGSYLDVGGNIWAPGGEVRLVSTATVYDLGSLDSRAGTLAAEMGVNLGALDHHVTIGGNIVTAGLWTNDALARNPFSPVVLDGGAITISAQGLMQLTSGSLLDASAGGWLKLDGKTWAVGKGGDITLTDSRPLGATAPMRLAGELRSYGALDSSLKASRGGKLTVSTLKVAIGGTAPTTPSDALLWLPENFFQQGGFSSYDMTGMNGMDVADGAVVTPRTLTRVFDARRAAAASGASLAGFSRPVELAWGVAKAERPETSLSLAASSDDFGSLRVGRNARIEVDPRASLTFSAVRGLTVEGTLKAPSGNIRLELKPPSSGLGYLADAAIWLGDSAYLDASGIARTYVGSDNRIQGEVLDGGAISLLAHNGYIIAQSGSRIDVSGTQAALDLPKATGNGYARAQLASAGGSVRLAASEGMFLGVDFKADGGSAAAPRGTLSMALDRPDIPDPDAVGNDYLTGLRSIELYADTPALLAYLLAPGTAVAARDNGRAALGASMLERFDHVSLKSRDRIVFEQSLDLALRGRLALDAPVLEVAGPAEVNLRAMAITLGNADPTNQAAGTHVPPASAGTGIFAADAGLIDVIGNWSLSGVKQARLNSDGDIRLTGVIPVGATSLVPMGRMETAGDLALTASQVYPTTLSVYTIESTKPDGRIALHGKDTVPEVPLAGGGAVTIKADYIDQGGVLRAPLGKIELDAGKTLTLSTGSLTSVSAEGKLIPYGRVANGRTWVYDLNVGTTASQISIFSGADGTLNLPTKEVLLKGENVVLQAGAKDANGNEIAPLDLSGGGDFYGYEFTPGPGGSADYLAQPGVYAILPANPNQAAPFDFQYAQYAYAAAQGAGLPSGRLLGTGATQQVKPGDSVYLSAIPELGIQAGYYTLLPSHYALLPGAVAVRAVANTVDMTASQNVRRTDGSYLVAGYRSALGDANIGRTRWSGFEVASRQVVASRNGFEFQYSSAELKAQTPSGRSEIHDYLASRLIPGIAALYDLPLPKFGQDAGRLGINAASSLALDGTIDFSRPAGALGGELDIASGKIAVTDGSQPKNVADPDQYLVLDVDRLASYGVDSLMLGGIREAIAGDAGSVRVNQVADAVVIETSAEKPLTAPEVMLVSKGSVTLADDSEVRGEGPGALKAETLVFGDDTTSGDGVLVRTSSGALRGVVRRNVSRSGNATDGLYTGSSALVYGEKSVNLDATYTAFNLGKVELGKDGALQLGATRIALGEVTDILGGVFVTNTLLKSLGTPEEVVLKSYSNFDVYGTATLGDAETRRLSLQGAGFVGVQTSELDADHDLVDGTLKNGMLTLEAGTVAFANPDGTPLDTSGLSRTASMKDSAGTITGFIAMQAGSGVMTVNADTIEFGEGGVETTGFNRIDLVARGEIAGVQGVGGLKTSGKLDMIAQRIVGYGGSDLSFTAGDTLTTANYVAKTTDGETEVLPQLGSAPLGARMTFSAANGIEHGGRIDMPAGWLSMTAENGDLKLLDGSSIFTGGVVRQFKGVNDTLEVQVAGGATTLAAGAGDLAIDQGATVDVSGQDGADAGRLAISVPAGTLKLNGQLTGTVTATADTPSPWSGSLALDAMMLDDGNEDTLNDFSALLQHIDGFGEGFSVRQRTGDLAVAAGDTVKARRVVLSVDDGVLDIAGTIDSRAAEGGWVRAAAGKEIYLRDEAVIDARATGANQRGGEVWLASGMNRDYVSADAHHGALVLENGSAIKVGGTLASEVRFDGNDAGDPDIVLTQVTGGRVHLQAPRIGSGAGTDVRITHKALTDAGMFAADDALGATIDGASLIEVLGNKVFDYSALGAAQMTTLRSDAVAFMGNASVARARIGGGTLGSSVAFQVRPGVEVRSSGDLTFSSDYDFGTITAAARNQPGTLTLRAAGKLLVNGNLSDGFNSATGTTLDSGESWSYRLVAGADLAAADPMAVQRNPDPGTGDFVLKGGKLIRTGTGSIQIAAGGDVNIGLNGDGSYNRASVVYTAGRADTNPAAYKAATDSQFRKVGYGVDGGALSIIAGGSIRAPEFGQLTNNWLQRRGTINSTDGITLSPAWGVAYEYFNQGVGALGGGNVRVEAGRDIESLSVSLPTTGRDYAAQSAGSKLFETGGGSAEIYAGGDIRGSFLYVQKGQGRVTAGGEIGAMPESDLDPDTSDNRNLILAMGTSTMAVTARNGLALETVFNPTVAATGTPVVNPTSSSFATKSSYNTDFFTYGDDSGVRLVTAQGDLLLSNDRSRVDENALFVDEVYGSNTPNAMTGVYVYPGSLTAAAPNGSLAVGNAFAMYPAARGQLHLLAQKDVVFDGGVAMSDVDPARLPSVEAPTKGFEVADALLFSIQDRGEYHAPFLTHLGDDDPVRVYAESGSIQYVPYDEYGQARSDTLYFPKPVEFLAGGDIRDVSLTAQHVEAGQTSYIWAARDISYKPLRLNGNLISNGTGIQVDGPGYLNVAAGRNIDLGSTQGIVTSGNLKNPALPSEGAQITLLSGMGADSAGRPRQPDYVSFAATYLAAGSAALNDFYASIEDFEIRRAAMLQPGNTGLDYAAVQKKLADPAYLQAMKMLAEPQIALAEAAFDALPGDVRVRRIFYHELEMAGREANEGLGYERANQAIAVFFPGRDEAGNPVDYAGGFSGFFSQVRTNQGGDIELLTPGGSVAVGLISNPPDLAAIRDESELGLFTVNGGSIRSYARNNFYVNTSRVFTLGQEKKPVRTTAAERLLRDDIMLFSLLGDIDAGKGAKTATAAPPPTYEYDNKGNLKVNLANSIAGSGIGVLLAREVIVPGDVSLIAPSGAVDSGDAGIRASGNLNIAAARVIGADNIQVSGLSIGVPAAVDSSGLGVSGVNSLGDAAKAAGDATHSLASATEDAQKAANDMRQSLASFKPNLVTVEVLGFGSDSAACGKEDDPCRKQKQGGT